ncbi:MAG: hypothetical protein OEV66_07900 [Spirochaetia bacterium]|nr:hypothetical protein [Spirochaetia bacterium]
MNIQTTQITGQSSGNTLNRIPWAGIGAEGAYIINGNLHAVINIIGLLEFEKNIITFIPAFFVGINIYL